MKKPIKILIKVKAMDLPVKHTREPALQSLCADCHMSDRIVLHLWLLYCKNIAKGQEKKAETLVRNLICKKNWSTKSKIVTFRKKLSEPALKGQVLGCGGFGSQHKLKRR